MEFSENGLTPYSDLHAPLQYDTPQEAVTMCARPSFQSFPGSESVLVQNHRARTGS